MYPKKDRQQKNIHRKRKTGRVQSSEQLEDLAAMQKGTTIQFDECAETFPTDLPSLKMALNGFSEAIRKSKGIPANEPGLKPIFTTYTWRFLKTIAAVQCRRRRSRLDPEDLAGMVFMNLCRKDKAEDQNHLIDLAVNVKRAAWTTYVERCVCNAINDDERTRKKRIEISVDDHDVTEKPVKLLENIARGLWTSNILSERMYGRLDQALSKLSIHEINIVNPDVRLRELAESHGVSIATMQKERKRLLHELRVALDSKLN